MSIRTAKGTNAAPTYGFTDDTNTGLHSPAADTLSLVAGGVELIEYNGTTLLPIARFKGSITGGSGSTGVFASFANPLGYDLVISNLVLRVTTQSTGASTLDIGIAANATTSNDGLIDGLSAAAAGLFTGIEDAGTNGEVSMVWGASQFLNVAEASGDVNGLVATLYADIARA